MINSQIPWSVPNVKGHSIDSSTGAIDTTEGFGAFDSVFGAHCVGVRVVDVGGGNYEGNIDYCLKKYQIILSVYDPYMRSEDHNRSVIEESRKKKFDDCLSLSVLNVINTSESRKEHIKLCRSLIKNTGKVFFKVWPGDKTGIPLEDVDKGRYQSNRDYKSYVPEICAVFGEKNVVIDEENEIIIAQKNDP